MYSWRTRLGFGRLADGRDGLDGFYGLDGPDGHAFVRGFRLRSWSYYGQDGAAEREQEWDKSGLAWCMERA